MLAQLSSESFKGREFCETQASMRRLFYETNLKGMVCENVGLDLSY
jgi:hypothetical protein